VKKPFSFVKRKSAARRTPIENVLLESALWLISTTSPAFEKITVCSPKMPPTLMENSVPQALPLRGMGKKLVRYYVL